MIAVDTNILVYAHREDSPWHEICLHHGVKKLWSADRDFTSFPDLVCENPLIQ